jgi:hypothetical protein
MTTLGISIGVSLIITFGIFFLEDRVIGLRGDSRFKRFWRKHIIGEYPDVW